MSFLFYCMEKLYKIKKSQCRLWRALAEHALKDRNFDMAEKSFVRCAEYQVTSSQMCHDVHHRLSQAAE